MDQMNQPPQKARKDRKKKMIALLAVLLILIAAGAFASFYMVKGSYRAQFTTRIVDKEPVDRLVAVRKIKDGRIIFFSEITGQKGKKVSHVWKSGDKVVYTHPFNITSDKWRANSEVSQWHFNAGGKAVVEIVGPDGKVLGTYSIGIE